MNRFLNLILFLVFSFSVYGQTYFNELYDIDNSGDLCGDVFELDSSFFLTGGTVLNDGKHELVTITTTKMGVLINKNRFSFGDTVFVRYGQSTKLRNGNIADFRTLQEYDAIMKEYRTWPVLTVFNPNGDTIWTKQYQDSNIFILSGQSLTETPDSGFILITDRQVTINNNNPILIRTDKLGNELFRKEIITNKIEILYEIKNTPNGEYIASGSGNSQNANFYDPWVIRFNDSLKTIWSNYYPSGRGIFARVAILKDSNIVISCDSLSNLGSPYGSYRCLKLDRKGTVIWDRKYFQIEDGGGYYQPLELPSGYLVMLGGYFRGNYPYRTLTKLTPDGDTIWMNQYHYQTDEDLNYVTDFISTSDSGFLLAGNVLPQSSNTQELWLLKVDSNGCNNPACDSRVYDIRLGIDYRPQINTEFKVFPNPAVNELNVVQQTAGETTWQYQLLNLNGQVLQRGEMGQTKTLDVSGLAKGSYVLQLQHGPVKKSYTVVK